MAALVPTTTSPRHVMGDLVFRSYVVTGTNGDTLTVPQGNLVQVDPTPTTSISIGCTIVGSVITFVTGGAFTARVGVWSETG